MEFKIRLVRENACINPCIFRFLSTHSVFMVVASKPVSQGLMLDFEKRMVTLDGKEIHLTPVEYKIVAYLSKNSGKVMTYASVMENVWGPFTDSNNRILRVNMANIRRKIERNPSQPQFLFTEVGVGYRMCEDENEM